MHTTVTPANVASNELCILRPYLQQQPPIAFAKQHRQRIRSSALVRRQAAQVQPHAQPCRPMHISAAATASPPSLRSWQAATSPWRMAAWTLR